LISKKNAADLRSQSLKVGLEQLGASKARARLTVESVRKTS
jgi:hypothetical protein